MMSHLSPLNNDYMLYYVDASTLKPTYSSVVKETFDTYYNEDHDENPGPNVRPTYRSVVTGKYECYVDETQNPNAHVKADVLLEIPNAKVREQI